MFTLPVIPVSYKIASNQLLPRVLCCEGRGRGMQGAPGPGRRSSVITAIVAFTIVPHPLWVPRNGWRGAEKRELSLSPVSPITRQTTEHER